MNTRIVFSNTNTSNSNVYEFEYIKMVIIRMQIRILLDSHEYIHEYFSLKNTYLDVTRHNTVLKLFNINKLMNLYYTLLLHVA